MHCLAVSAIHEVHHLAVSAIHQQEVVVLSTPCQEVAATQATLQRVFDAAPVMLREEW